VCAAFAERLSDATATGASLIGWPGDPSAKADSVPLRVAGALHALARDEHHPELAACYPPNDLPDAHTLWRAIEPLLESEQSHFNQYLQHAPQTNEVGRSALLMAGLLEIAKHTKQPKLQLFEIGASAGLNLILDRYRYRFGGAKWGNQNARLCLRPAWSGDAPPVDASIEVIERRGVDLNPLDLSNPEERARMLSYVWADQTDRFARIESAIDAALEDLPAIDREDAADWLEQRLHVEGTTGITRVLMHSIVWNYLSDATRNRIEAHLHSCAANSNRQCPLAWMRFELNDDVNAAVLRVTVWPDGETKDLALGHPHGSRVEYLAHL
jgi:hypothetical protein